MLLEHVEAPPPFTLPQEIAFLSQHYESLKREEQHIPHGEAATFWLIADTVSGETERRKQLCQKRECDLFLLRCGYRLYQPLPSQDNRYGRLLYLFTYEYSRCAALLPLHFYQEGLVTLEQWKAFLLHVARKQTHVVCQCYFPLLRETVGDVTQYYEYRSVTSGPEHPYTLSHCPLCRIALDIPTTREVTSAQAPFPHMQQKERRKSHEPPYT